jgi:hypothetical protein
MATRTPLPVKRSFLFTSRALVVMPVRNNNGSWSGHLHSAHMAECRRQSILCLPSMADVPIAADVCKPPAEEKELFDRVFLTAREDEQPGHAQIAVQQDAAVLSFMHMCQGCCLDL